MNQYFRIYHIINKINYDFDMQIQSDYKSSSLNIFILVCSVVICRIDHLLIRAFILGKKEESNKHANVAIILNCPENQTRKRALQQCCRKNIFIMFKIFRYSSNQLIEKSTFNECNLFDLLVILIANTFSIFKNVLL